MTELPAEIEIQREEREITAWFVLAGALLVIAAVGLSLWWNRAPGRPRPRRPSRPEVLNRRSARGGLRRPAHRSR